MSTKRPSRVLDGYFQDLRNFALKREDDLAAIALSKLGELIRQPPRGGTD